MIRKLSRHFLNSPSVINGDNEETIENNSEYQDEIEMPSLNGPKYNSVGSSVLGKKAYVQSNRLGLFCSGIKQANR